mmetsp:Transcript_10091/g.14127  ORF Transcript_10091/g.14127 Transcript_10091/m.14127 type:complete len:207 (-) Transcript_10091:284-904(-)
MTSGAIQQAVPTPWVIVRWPLSATARALPQSPILASSSWGLFSWMKMLCDLRSRCTMGASWLCRYSIPSATSMASCSRRRVDNRVRRSFSTCRRLPRLHSSETIHRLWLVMLHPYKCRTLGCRRKLMMAASPTISCTSSLRCRAPPLRASCANTNSFTATLEARQTPAHTRPNEPSPMMLLSFMSFGSMMFRVCWPSIWREAIARL